MRPDVRNIALVAEAWREGGLWRIRLMGPPWFLADLARELNETGQQLDLLGDTVPAGTDPMWGTAIDSVDIGPAPRRPRKPRRRSGKDAPPVPVVPVVVNVEEFMKP